MSRNVKLPKIDNPNIFFKKNKEEAKRDVKRNKYWRSLNVLNNSSSQEVVDAKKQEFPEGQDQELNIDEMNPVSRRKFLALMTASGVFATAACTDYRDKGAIVNYASKPEEIQPGVPNYYASTLSYKGNAWGVLVKTREGRPIKLDGNPENPINKGKIDVVGQAHILELYDPERIQVPLSKEDSNYKKKAYNDLGEKDSDVWKSYDEKILAALNGAKASGKEIAILTNKITSPTTKKLFDDFSAKYPTTKVYSFEQSTDLNRDLAWQDSYGEPDYPGVHLDKADVILSIDSDFLASDGDYIENTRHYSSRRDIDNVDNFNKLYSVEGGFSLTGANADYRFRLTPELYHDFLMSLASDIAKKTDSMVVTSNLMSAPSVKDFARANGMNAQKIGYLIDDLMHSKGKSIVLGGGHLPKQTHVLINLINEMLGNTSLYRKDGSAYHNVLPLSSNNDIKNLVSDMNSGNVGVLINIDTNPVFTLPRNLKFTEASKNVGTIITFALQKNETTNISDYILPSNHFLESWNDHQTRKGVMSLQQPVISELYSSRQPEACLLHWHNGGEYSYDIYHKYLMKRWESNVHTYMNSASPFKEFWYNSLHDGVVTADHRNESEMVFNPNANYKLNSSKSGFTLLLTENPNIGDGRFANNGFLQETPHPISKVTWDNYASLSPRTADNLGVNFQDWVSITVGGSSLNLPVVVQPGLADNLVQIDLGYGRTDSGSIADNVGFDANVFFGASSALGNRVISGAKVEATVGEEYKLATTQEHHQLDDTVGGSIGEAANSGEPYKIAEFHKERHIIQEKTVKEYQDWKNGHHGDHGGGHGGFLYEHDTKSIMPNHEYKDIKWAMAVDMNKCTGCNACITACNVESNIPVVGKDQVLVGREMHWMRMDRYYSGDGDDPRVSIQPMLCQHCDNAPCENVCPVVATTHSPEGINQMVYNRCVGTRYCMNNCPYKVRRFNFYDFRDNLAKGFYYSESMQHVYNPEVTVRSRGVVEKCDFCTSRIYTAKANATKENREFKGSDVITACQEACPANAIYFGDSNDPNSTVSKLREHDLGYHVLDVLDVKPQVTYLAKLNNVVPESNGEHGNNH
jgi:molybdopterin-containing oxidoreductase family iron-sulfur binding subunit